VDGPGGRTHERQPEDAHVRAAHQRNQVADRVLSRKCAAERQLGLLHADLVGVDIAVLDVAEPPLVLGLAVDRAPTLERDVFRILSVDERTPVEVLRVLAGIEGRACLQVQGHVAAQVERTGGISSRRKVDDAAPGRTARIDRLLDGGVGIVVLIARRAEIAHVVECQVTVDHNSSGT